MEDNRKFRSYDRSLALKLSAADEDIVDETRLYSDVLMQNKVEFYRWQHRRTGVPHYHRFIEMCLYMGKQPFDYLVDERKFTMHSGDLLYIPPMSIHCALVSELIQHEEYDRYVLWADVEWFRELLGFFPGARLDLPGQIVTHGTKWEILRVLFEKGCSAYEKPSWRILTNAVAAQIGACTCMAVQEWASVGGDSHPSEVLLQAIEYVNRHYHQNLSLQQVAEACHISRSTLAHSFSRELGISFNKYIFQKRMAETERLLLQNVPLKAICRQVGYTDYPTFYRAFRKQYGMSPSEYCEILHTGKE